MEKILCLMLKSETFTALPLLIADSNEIDKFTSKKFENQEQMLKHYAKQINFFLESNKIKIEEYQNQHKKNIPWKLAVLEKRASYNREINYIKRSVLYKKHTNPYVVKELLSNDIILKKLLNILSFLKMDSPFIRDLINRKKKKQTDINTIYSQITKKKEHYYTLIRWLHNAYQGFLLDNEAPSIDEIYQNYLIKTNSVNEVDKVYETVSFEQLKPNEVSYEQNRHKSYR